MTNLIRLSDYQAPANIPDVLKSLPNWLVWRLAQIPGEPKPRKIPLYTNGHLRGWPNGKPADEVPTAAQPHAEQGSGGDRAMLVTYERAVAACIKGGYSGVGFALFQDSGIVALDFDDCVDTTGQIDARVIPLIEGTYSEISPSGSGIRAFYQGTLRSKKDNQKNRTDGLVNVEVFGDTGYVTFTGNATIECSLFELQGTVAPLTDAVMAMYRKRWPFADNALVPSNLADFTQFASLKPTQGWTLAEARAILADCDPNTDRDHWLKALMALHHEFNGSAEALDLAVEWSSQGLSFQGRRDVEGRWRSFGKGSSSSITGKWLTKWQGECNTRKRYSLTADWKSQIAQVGDEYTLRETICPKLALDTLLGDLERELLAQALVERFRALGSKYPIAACRKLIAPPKVHVEHSQADAPKWVTGGCYITDEDKFFYPESDERLTMQAFNAKFNRELPPTDEFFVSAGRLALDMYRMPTVTRAMYLPWAGQYFDAEGVSCVNTYRKSSVPVADTVITEAGRLAILIIQSHLRMICGGREDVYRQVLDFIAHNVQQPGVKIRFALLFKGIEGDGKSLIGSLLKAVLGDTNVKEISSKVLSTDFTDWAHGACIGMIEELRMIGHNRHDTYNTLKAPITNNTVTVHPKGKAEHTVINTMNYLAFTNHADALPLSDTDRRWLVVFTPFHSLADLVAQVGDVGAYFDKIFDALETQRGALRAWLLAHKISPEFKADGRAPNTSEKASMVALGISAEEEAVQAALEMGGVGIGPNALTTSSLASMIQTFDMDANLNTSAMARVLSKLGWSKVPRQIKWNGGVRRVWVQGIDPQDMNAVRLALDATVTIEDVTRLFG